MTSSQKPARVRFAPSPTGLLHIGGARTALYDYLLARQTGGAFILRLEDTDRKRFQAGAEEDIKNALEWLGLKIDEGPDQGGPFGPYIQSERVEIYHRYTRQLIEDGSAYPCFCSAERLEEVRKEQQKQKQTPHYDGTCRQITPDEAAGRVQTGEPHVIRFKAPREGTTTCTDLLRGEITVDNTTLDDIVLVKTNGLPVYHLAAMVDDHLMEISHVIRTSEWLPTFPIHVLIYRAMGWEEPVWIHPSVLLKPDGKGKMSKRDSDLAREKGYPIFVNDMADLGYIPEAVLNWLALMGWSYDDKTEFFTRDDLVEKFSLEKLNPSPAAINFSKLDHFNGLHIRALDQADFARRIKPWFENAGLEVKEEILLPVAGALQNRTKKLTDVVEMGGFFFQDEVDFHPERVVGEKFSAAQALETIQGISELLKGLDPISQDSAEQPLRQLAADLDIKAGQVFGLLREALAGQKVSPPIFDITSILGRDLVMTRLENARSVLEGLV